MNRWQRMLILIKRQRQTVSLASQTVDWLVLTHHVEAAETDIARFAKLFPMNARPVQKLDRRFILTSGTR